MPAKSKAQQRFFGMVDAYKKGELKHASKAIKDAAKGMTKKEVKDFASTKTDKLPEKVEEGVVTIDESQLRRIVKESVHRILKEGVYGYPDGSDHIIFLAENDKECIDVYEAMARALTNKFKRGIELSVDVLTNSSWMKKFQQLCFRKFKAEQLSQGIMTKESPYLFRKHMAEKLIGQVRNGEYDN